ncbi:MAG TPA: NAD(P)H-quinone oxidoreductase [Devosia sp.]|nr:NAD(P)H-quinone oxidoreductase [Devosia sp.]
MSLPATMTAIVCARPGGPEVLEARPIAAPAPRDGEVVIRVAAAGVNAPDLAQRRGDYPAPEGHSPLLGLEVSGEIVGPAGEWKVGDRVVALTNGGAYAEYVAVPSTQVLPLPASWTLNDAAALPECWFTITQTLIMRAGLEAGMWVLIHGGAGGLGGAAVQMCRMLGARPIAVVSSGDKATYAISLGADAVIRHDSEDFVLRTRELTSGHGADRILDMQGGATTTRNIDAAARFGHIVMVATLADRGADLPMNKLIAKQLTISGSTLRHQSAVTKAAIAARLLREFWPSISTAGFTRPRVKTFPLDAAADAHRAMEDRAHYGKIVLQTAFGAGQLR